jgi:hypothetical protein
VLVAGVLVAGVVVAGVVVAACGSGSRQPAGLSGSQAGAPADQQYTSEDRATTTVLTPKTGSFLAGKATVTALGSTTPADGVT